MNKKKHTIIKKRLSILSILVPLFLIFGCAKDTTPPVNIPKAPIVKESVVPHLEKVSSGIDKGIESNKKIDSKIKQQKDTVIQQKVTIVETIAKFEKLREKVLAEKAIQEIELIDIINSLKTIDQRNLFLETQIKELDEIRKEQEDILRLTKEDASITYRKLIDKENETLELRNQNQFLANNLMVKNKEVQTLQSDLEKEKVKSAKASVYKNWVIGLVSAFVLWLIIKNVLMIYFPMTKFRI